MAKGNKEVEEEYSEPDGYPEDGDAEEETADSSLSDDEAPASVKVEVLEYWTRSRQEELVENCLLQIPFEEIRTKCNFAQSAETLHTYWRKIQKSEPDLVKKVERSLGDQLPANKTISTTDQRKTKPVMRWTARAKDKFLTLFLELSDMKAVRDQGFPRSTIEELERKLRKIFKNEPERVKAIATKTGKPVPKLVRREERGSEDEDDDDSEAQRTKLVSAKKEEESKKARLRMRRLREDRKKGDFRPSKPRKPRVKQTRDWIYNIGIGETATLNNDGELFRVLRNQKGLITMRLSDGHICATQILAQVELGKAAESLLKERKMSQSKSWPPKSTTERASKIPMLFVSKDDAASLAREHNLESLLEPLLLDTTALDNSDLQTFFGELVSTLCQHPATGALKPKPISSVYVTTKPDWHREKKERYSVINYGVKCLTQNIGTKELNVTHILGLAGMETGTARNYALKAIKNRPGLSTWSHLGESQRKGLYLNFEAAMQLAEALGVAGEVQRLLDNIVPEVDAHTTEPTIPERDNGPLPARPVGHPSLMKMYDVDYWCLVTPEGQEVFMRHEDSSINATHILKLVPISQQVRTRELKWVKGYRLKDKFGREFEQKEFGWGPLSGTWLPFNSAIRLAKRWRVQEIVAPLTRYKAAQIEDDSDESDWPDGYDSRKIPFTFVEGEDTSTQKPLAYQSSSVDYTPSVSKKRKGGEDESESPQSKRRKSSGDVDGDDEGEDDGYDIRSDTDFEDEDAPYGSSSQHHTGIKERQPPMSEQEPRGRLRIQIQSLRKVAGRREWEILDKPFKPADVDGIGSTAIVISRRSSDYGMEETSQGRHRAVIESSVQTWKKVYAEFGNDEPVQVSHVALLMTSILPARATIDTYTTKYDRQCDTIVRSVKHAPPGKIMLVIRGIDGWTSDVESIAKFAEVYPDKDIWIISAVVENWDFSPAWIFHERAFLRFNVLTVKELAQALAAPNTARFQVAEFIRVLNWVQKEKREGRSAHVAWMTRGRTWV